MTERAARLGRLDPKAWENWPRIRPQNGSSLRTHHSHAKNAKRRQARRQRQAHR